MAGGEVMAAFQKFDLSLIPGTETTTPIPTTPAPTLASLAGLAGGKPIEAEIARWLNSHPPESLDPDHCAQCHRPLGRIGEDAIPVLSGGGSHVWLHHQCHPGWMAKRTLEAEAALAEMGLSSKR